MSSFTSDEPILMPLITTKGSKTFYEVIYDFQYHVGSYPSDNVIIIKRGFVTDLGSIPLFLQWFIPKDGPMAKPAIVHDWLMFETDTPYRECHRVLKEAMLVAGFSKFKAELVYIACAIKYPKRR